MNIYLDIDGVILGTQSPAEDIGELLEYILKHYPDSTYWLTTHCKGGTNRCAGWLRQNRFPEKLVAALEAKVKPTDWNVLKTDAIDLDQPFVWLDDAPLASERYVLERHGVSDSCIVMNKRDPEAARHALEQIKAAGKRFL